MTTVLRLVVHTDAVTWGGAEAQLATLLANLPDTVRVHVVGGSPDIVDRLVAARSGAVGILAATPSSPGDLRRLRDLRRTFAELSPDVIHVNLTWTGGNRGGLLAALAAAPARAVAVDHLPGRLPTASGRWLARRLARRARAYVTVGQLAARAAEDALALPSGAVQAIHNGVPDIGAKPAASCSGGRRILGTVCRLESQKGVDILLTALGAVPGTELIVVGEGSQRASLARLAARCGIADRVRFVGSVADVGSWLRQMDVFVSASRADGLPLAVLEAMVVGLPVVATDVGSVREAVRDGETGVLVPVADPAALAAALRTITDRSDLAAAMGQAGRRRALAEFGVPRMVERYLGVYTGGRAEAVPQRRAPACRLEAVVARAAARGRGPLPTLAPVALADVELSRELPPLAVSHPDAAVLVRLHGEPLGWARLRTPNGRVPPAELAEAIWTALAEQIRQHRAAEGAPVPTCLKEGGLLDGSVTCRPRLSLPAATVVVATNGRPRLLARCLRSILDSDHPDFEVVVVDNTADPIPTRQVVDALSDPRLRVVSEPRRGTSSARNTGVRHTSTSVVAFTDDDVTVDPQWLSSLAAMFVQQPQLAAVTGLTLPLELETSSQLWFERFGGFGRGLRPFTVDRFSRNGLPLLFPYSVGALGGGGNLAVLRRVFNDLGGLRERLGPGTATFGGEDLDIIARILRAGHRIGYQPRAIVRHAHRRDDDAVRLQAFTYGAGLTAQLTQYIAEPAFLRLLAGRLPAVLRMLAASRPPPAATPAPVPADELPPQLRRRELLGYVYGPIGLAHAAWHARGQGR